jgi:hypothetical protein
LSADLHDLYAHAAIAFQQLEQLPGHHLLEAPTNVTSTLADAEA